MAATSRSKCHELRRRAAGDRDTRAGRGVLEPGRHRFDVVATGRSAAAGHSPDTLPIAATVTTEFDVEQMGAEHAAGRYMTTTYFRVAAQPTNRRYVT
ncbi:transporter substrate-binding protein [Pseudonocardia sp. MCCB 268]|nr:transporter substrate-binding protein [Pseudonocardia cytotoxica]